MDSNHRCPRIRRVSCHWKNLRFTSSRVEVTPMCAIWADRSRVRCLKARWSARQGSNLRLPHCKCGTRTAELRAVMIARSPLNIDVVSPHVAKLHCTPKRVVNGRCSLESYRSSSGGKGRTRTDTRRFAKAVLSQLSYNPKNWLENSRAVVGGAGIEPA